MGTWTATPERCVSAPSVCFRAAWTAPSARTEPCPACRRTSSRGDGAHVLDADGNEFIDYVLAYGPHILGHQPPQVLAAIRAQLERGIAYGHTVELEVDLAERIVAAVESVEMVRFVTSGTEAAMSAVRLARAATGRDRIVKFAGGYHGHADALLAEAGSGIATLGIPGSPGVPAARSPTRSCCRTTTSRRSRRSSSARASRSRR